MSNKAFSGFRREYVRTSTADVLDFLQKFTPVNNTDAATKKYVDDVAAAAGSAKGPDTAVQFKSGGTMAGDAAFTFDSGTGTMESTEVSATSTLTCADATAATHARAVTVNATGAATAATASASTSLLANTAAVTGAITATQAVSATGAFQAANLTATSTFTSTGSDVQADSVLVGPAPADASAAMTINSTTQGLKLPNMTTVERVGLSAIDGMVLYDTDLQAVFVRQNGVWVNPTEIEYNQSMVQATFTFPDSQNAGTGDTIIFPTLVSTLGSKISYNSLTGAFTLAANGTYVLQLNAQIFGSNQAVLFFRTTAGTLLGGGAKTVITPVDLAVQQSSGGTCLLVYGTGPSTATVEAYVNFASSPVFIQPGSHVVIYEI